MIKWMFYHQDWPRFHLPLLAEMFDSRLRPEACSGNLFFLLIWRGFKPQTRKQGQFMSATRLDIVSSTTKFIFLHDSLRLRKLISLVYSIPLTARSPFPIQQACRALCFSLTLWQFIYEIEDKLIQIIGSVCSSFGSHPHVNWYGRYGKWAAGKKKAGFSIVTCRVLVYLGTFILSKKRKVHSTRLLTFSLTFVFTFVLLFSHFYSASLYFCIFLHLCSLVFL